MTTWIKPIAPLDAKFRGHLGYSHWTICLGAGASTGIVPSWFELTRRLVNQIFGATFSADEFKLIVSDQGWSLDSWIQACANKYILSGGTLPSFQRAIRDLLYSDLLIEAITAGVEDDLKATIRWPRVSRRNQIEKVCAFLEAQYGNTSLLALVKWLLAANKKDKLPYAIISFNAEPLLHTVFELFQRRQHYAGPPPYSGPRYRFTRIIRPNIVPKDVSKDGGKICIYHCHGALFPDSPKVKGTPKEKLNNSLIFLEEDYLKVSSKAATWPETLFMFHAHLTRLVFIGMSMCDPNIRRWLGLSEELAAAGQTKRGASHGPPHIWLTRKPSDPKTAEVNLTGLWHLGVRPAWMNDWKELGAALSNLTAV